MRRQLLPVLLASAFLCPRAALAQVKPEAQDLEPRPVAASDDPVNRKVTASTIDALVLVVTIDGPGIRLDSATPARIPRAAAQRKRELGGDRVTAVGFAGGARISETSAADAVLNAEEGGGLVRVETRQVTLALAAPRAIDTVEVSAPATGASSRLDVRGAYAPYASACTGDAPDPRLCPLPAEPVRPR
jgi:hypothetical protein